MKTAKRFGLCALLAVTLALCTSKAASAADILTPPPGSPAGASGTASTKYSGPYLVCGDYDCYSYWDAHTQFRVKGLRPLTTYLFQVTAPFSSSTAVGFVTDRRGNGAGSFGWTSLAGPGNASYQVFTGDGLVLVLVGQE